MLVLYYGHIQSVKLFEQCYCNDAGIHRLSIPINCLQWLGISESFIQGTGPTVKFVWFAQNMIKYILCREFKILGGNGLLTTYHRHRGSALKLCTIQLNITLLMLFCSVLPLSMVCAVLQERSKSVEVELESFANSPVFCTVKQKSTATKSSESYILLLSSWDTLKSKNKKQKHGTHALAWPFA